MKKSRIIALLTAVAMIMSVVPAFASGYFVDQEGTVFEKNGENLVTNPGFEEGSLTGITQNDEYYEVSDEEAHSGTYSLKAIKSTKGEGALTAYFPVENPSDSYYLSFWYKNNDTVARRPRVTFAFTDSSKTIPTEENDFTDLTNAWIGAGTATNDCDMAYSKGNWVQYSTVITGTGSDAACAYVVLNIYGLTKGVTYVDDFEVYALSYSEQYGKMMANAKAEWSKKTIPSGALSGIGTLNLPREVSTDGILVEWRSSSENVNAETGSYVSGAEQELVILTARLYAEGLYDEVYFEYEYPYILKSMFDPYVEWIKKEIFDKIGTAVDSDLSLPKSHAITGYDDAEITWSCSDEKVLSPEGKFTAPETTKYVEIIATIHCGDNSKTTSTRVKALGGNLVPEGLIMYYDFEKPITKATVYDNSQRTNVYNATAESGVTVVDGYAKFSGSNSTLILPANYATELTGSYSVSMWVKLDKNVASSEAMYRFFDFGGGTYTSQFLRYTPASGQLAFMDRETAGGGGNWPLTTTATGFGDTWKLVSFTYDFTSSPAQAKVYVDGALVGTSGGTYASTLTRSINDVATNSSTSGYIGRTQWYNGDNPDFMGLMDDVRIYNRAISAEEIALLYNETRPTVTAPVIIKFVDSAGNVLRDDVTVEAEVGATYDVPAEYKSISGADTGGSMAFYKYLSSKSTDSIEVSDTDANVCTLVFKLTTFTSLGNVLENGSFEQNVDGWTSNNGGITAPVTGWVRSNEKAHDGSYSLKLASSVGSANASNLGTYIPVETGKLYKLSFWEYVENGISENSLMSAACVTKSNTLATDTPTNHLVGEYGGFSSWYNIANGISPRDRYREAGWVKVEYTFDLLNATDANYVFIAYAWGPVNEVFIDEFVLEAFVADAGEGEETELVPVTIKYVDTEGNKLADDITVNVNSTTQTYTVPASYTVLDDKTEGSVIYKYTYLEEESNHTIGISILRDNIATLVFDVIKADKNSNIMVDGGFDDGNGNFSWGNWQSPETGNYFKDNCSTWFYVVNRDTNNAVEYTNSITANDYALGTRWNDGTTGLCSMANFVEVKAGKTYIVSYDYKHKTGGVDGSYISTSFVEKKNLSANPSGYNIPKNVSTEWQTNTFTITAPKDGYIYFHFSWLGSGGSSNTGNNAGQGPYWYFDNFEVLEVITFENKISYSNGYAEILAEDGTTGYLVQALYDADGALTSVKVSDMLTLNKETPVKVEVTKGAKLMLVKDLVSLEPLAKAIIAE